MNVVGCGKKGPPLPPLVKLPAAPVDLTAERRGAVVDLQFTVPAANTDGTRPANVSGVDVYAVTLPVMPAPLADAQLLKLGTKVASIPAKAPRDPDVTSDADDPDAEAEPVEGDGLDQGAMARATETITPAMLKPINIPKAAKGTAAVAANGSGPLLGPPSATPVRTYVIVGVTTRGKDGPLSKRIAVPLVLPPPPPAMLGLKYDETAVTVTWSPVSAAPPSTETGGEAVLPSRPIGTVEPTIAYNVYDVSGPAAVKLTSTPIAETRFVDARIAWDEKRCYVARTAATLSGLAIESEGSPQTCETLKDTFPPAAPKALQGVPSDGAINLIWEPNTEKDLAGYVVLRATAPNADLQPITAAPIQEPSFRDGVQPGARYVYAVRAVDKAGNLSPISNRVEETAR